MTRLVRARGILWRLAAGFTILSKHAFAEDRRHVRRDSAHARLPARDVCHLVPDRAEAQAGGYPVASAVSAARSRDRVGSVPVLLTYP